MRQNTGSSFRADAGCCWTSRIEVSRLSSRGTASLCPEVLVRSIVMWIATLRRASSPRRRSLRPALSGFQPSPMSRVWTRLRRRRLAAFEASSRRHWTPFLPRWRRGLAPSIGSLSTPTLCPRCCRHSRMPIGLIRRAKVSRAATSFRAPEAALYLLCREEGVFGICWAR